MSSPQSNAPVTESNAAQNSTSTNATATAPTAAAAASASSTFSSMKALKAKAPAVYNAIMKGIAMNICNEMEEEQRKLKEQMEEEREDLEG